jgi:hypothetical protein
VSAVRNDLGGRDTMVRVAPFTGYLGASGWAGFRDMASVVHTARRIPCKRCRRDGVAPVHNLVHPGFRHSDVFVGEYHIATQYLPFFFDIDPVEYRRFVKTCRAYVSAERTGDAVLLRRCERTLHMREWRAFGGHTLETFLIKQLHARLGTNVVVVRSSALTLAIRRICHIVDRAFSAREAGMDSPSQILAMRPYIAAVRALDGFN